MDRVPAEILIVGLFIAVEPPASCQVESHANDDDDDVGLAKRTKV